jgi:hypothetical protein
MSHRSSDPYARRPTKDDDRRSPDARDRRRDSYSRDTRGASDPYKDDRYHRDRDADSSLRDRRNPSKTSRDVQPVNSAKPILSLSLARTEHGTKACELHLS